MLRYGHHVVQRGVLGTLLNEVTAIINARLFVLVSADPDMPAVLSPATLLNPKTDAAVVPRGNFDTKDIHNTQHKQAESLVDSFWR